MRKALIISLVFVFSLSCVFSLTSIDTQAKRIKPSRSQIEAPTNLLATASSTSEINFSWDDNSDN